MKILFVCHRLITFIINDIVELEALGNDITILSMHKDPNIFNKIVLPMLTQHGLDNKTHVDFVPPKSRGQLLSAFGGMLIRDFLFHPLRTVRSLAILKTLYPKNRNRINCYIETRPVLDQSFDVVHAPFSTLDSIKMVYYVSKILNVPYTLSFRAHDLHVLEDFNRTLDHKELIKGAASIFTISQDNKNILQRQLNLDRTIEIIHGAVDTLFFKPEGEEKSANSLIAVCRFHPQKGIIYLLEACRLLHERKVPYRCQLIGEGREEQKYKEIIQQHQIPNISIVNYLDRDGVKAALAKSELFVLPCVVLEDGTRDILPNAIKEAMSMALPVITSDISGIRELVDDHQNGILVRPERPSEIADAIALLFQNRTLMVKMGQNGRQKIISDFNIKREAAKMHGIFLRCASAIDVTQSQTRSGLPKTAS